MVLPCQSGTIPFLDASRPWIMEFIQTSIGAFVVSAIAGTVLSGGLYFLRRTSWELAKILGWIGLLGLGLAALAVLVTLFRSSSQGGDAGMAAVTLLIFGLMGSAVGLGLALLIGFGQARALDRPIASGLFVGIPDAFLLAFCMYWGMGFIHQAVERPVTDEWWQRELARRQKRQQQLNEIPPQYRENIYGVLQQIDQDRRFRRQNGLPEIETVPRDIENKMRNYWNETGTQVMPVPDRSGYQRAGAMRKGALPGILAGWIVGAFALPWVFRTRQPQTGKPSSPQEPGP